MILIFDTETSGLVHGNLPDDNPTQPRLVQLGAVLYQDDGTVRSRVSLIQKPEGYVIPDGAAKVHGITTAIATAVGVPSAVILSVYLNLRRAAQVLGAYNIDFDLKVIAVEIARSGRSPSHPGPDKNFCVMKHITPIVGLPPTAKMVAAGFTKNKPPNLTEAMKHFFGEGLPGAHDALVDAEATGRLYFHTRKMEVSSG